MSLQRNQRRPLRPHLAHVLNGKQKRELRAMLRRRDGDECFYCLHPLGEDETLEHLQRWADGGSNHPYNCVLAHADCNRATKDLTVDEKMLRRGDALLARLRCAPGRVAA